MGRTQIQTYIKRECKEEFIVWAEYEDKTHTQQLSDSHKLHGSSTVHVILIKVTKVKKELCKNMNTIYKFVYAYPKTTTTTEISSWMVRLHFTCPFFHFHFFRFQFQEKKNIGTIVWWHFPTAAQVCCAIQEPCYFLIPMCSAWIHMRTSAVLALKCGFKLPPSVYSITVSHLTTRKADVGLISVWTTANLSR